MIPTVQLAIIGFLSPALAHLIGAASVAPLLLFTAVVSYPISVVATFALLMPLHRLFSLRSFSRKEQLGMVLFTAVSASIITYLCLFGGNLLAFGAEAFSSLLAAFYAGYGAVVGLICWLFYNWGPFRVSPRRSNSPVNDDDKSRRVLP